MSIPKEIADIFDRPQTEPKMPTADDFMRAFDKVIANIVKASDPHYHCKKCGGKGTCYCEVANNE